LLRCKSAADDPDDTPRGLAAIVRDVDFRRITLSLLRTVERSPTARSELAGKSYRHHNGFIHIALGYPRSRRLVAHLWPPEERETGDVHDHRWHLASRILHGAVRVEQLTRRASGSDDARRYRGYIHTLLPDGNGYSLEPAADTSLEVVRSELVRSGGVHMSHLTELHRVSNPGLGRVWAVTLMLRGPSRRHSTSVYSSGSQRTLGERDPLPRLTDDETVDVLRALATLATEPESFDQMSAALAGAVRPAHGSEL
jgi:hypothetical protein